MATDYDILVVGGGHAGAEAAHAAARLGARTGLITFDRAAIGRPSCNPAIGGIGKGQMVREIDALGGLMGRVTDEAGIQFRMLNRRKGPALWSPRAQIDSRTYPAVLQRYLAECDNLDVIEAGVDELLAESGAGTAWRVCGVVLHDGRRLRAGAVVITSGTFLRGLMHTGEQKSAGGRVGEQAAVGLSGALERVGLRLGRLKTGTPPRVARDSVDFSRLGTQAGDAEPVAMSFMTSRLGQPQVCCWTTSTNADIHELIRRNLHRAPMYSGQIESLGPRYCPSIEDKVVRFADKTAHQIFIEPETVDGERLYLNGISTSLPRDVQERIVRQVPGLERARIVQWGYAVEYDFVPPEQILPSLMTKSVAGLFLAGQVNGTSGYEEAAGQGLLAGVNAAQWLREGEPVVLGRDQAYLGVMIDDLVTQRLVEPYRMFTSRAEHRMHLRYDNADTRLTGIGRDVGLVQDDRWEGFRSRQELLAVASAQLDRLRVDGQTLRSLLRRPEEDGRRFLATFPELAPLSTQADVWASVLVEVKYEGYLQRQQRVIDDFRQQEAQQIPVDVDFAQIRHLRREAVERWSAVRPHSVGQAARVSGIRPTDLSILLLHLARRERALPESPTSS